MRMKQLPLQWHLPSQETVCFFCPWNYSLEVGYAWWVQGHSCTFMVSPRTFDTSCTFIVIFVTCIYIYIWYFMYFHCYFFNMHTFDISLLIFRTVQYNLSARKIGLGRSPMLCELSFIFLAHQASRPSLVAFFRCWYLLLTALQFSEKHEFLWSKRLWTTPLYISWIQHSHRLNVSRKILLSMTLISLQHHKTNGHRRLPESSYTPGLCMRNVKKLAVRIESNVKNFP